MRGGFAASQWKESKRIMATDRTRTCDVTHVALSHNHSLFMFYVKAKLSENKKKVMWKINIISIISAFKPIFVRSFLFSLNNSKFPANAPNLNSDTLWFGKILKNSQFEKNEEKESKNKRIVNLLKIVGFKNGTRSLLAKR